MWSGFNSEQNAVVCLWAVVRASVRRMLLDDVFEQKNDIAKNVEEELEKVNFLYSFLIATIFVSPGSSLRMLSVLQA